jgi:transcriptional regulator with XRE-family HTH domain
MGQPQPYPPDASSGVPDGYDQPMQDRSRLLLYALKAVRKRKGMTQRQIGEAIDKDTDTIRRVENHQQDFTNHLADAIASTLGEPTYAILGYTHPPDTDLSPERLEAAHLLDELSDDGVVAALNALRSLKALGHVRAQNSGDG